MFSAKLRIIAADDKFDFPLSMLNICVFVGCKNRLPAALSKQKIGELRNIVGE